MSTLNYRNLAKFNLAFPLVDRHMPSLIFEL